MRNLHILTSKISRKALRGAVSYGAAVLLCFLFVFTSLADQTSDSPILNPTSSEAATEVSSEDMTSSAGGSSSSSISDQPIIDNKSGKKKTEIGESTQAATTKTTEASTTGTSKKETESSAAEQETTAPASGADLVEVSDEPIPTNTNKKKNEINSATQTATTAAESSDAVTTQAATTEETTTQAETTASGPTPGTSGSSSGPSSSASGAPGSVHAGDASTRLELGFTLISPTHAKSGLKVARAAISLTSGSWQELSYKDNIRYPYYMYNDQRTDSSGVLWYIARVYARRFGDTTSDDGAYKTSLWMNASDCALTSSITVPTTNSTRLAIVKAALSMVGKQYVYGGSGPDSFDCSGLVKYVYKQAGLTVPRTSYQLMELDGQISAAELRPGDIMVRSGHAGIYIGNDIFVHASDSSVGVVAENLSVYNQSNKFTTFINVIGD